MIRRTTALKILLGVLGVTALALFVTGEPRQALGLLVLTAMIGAFIFGAWWFRDRPRAESHQAEARRLRLSYSFKDPHDIGSFPHPLLHRLAEVRVIEHVSWGSWLGLDVEVFEYWYASEDPGAPGQAKRFTCVLTAVPATWPDLSIEPKRLATQIADAVGLPAIRSESIAFNEAFHVRSSDPRFASAVVDAQMISWLLDDARDHGFQIAAGKLLTFTGQVHPWETERVLGMAGGFLAKIPRAVASLYPAPS